MTKNNLPLSNKNLMTRRGFAKILAASSAVAGSSMLLAACGGDSSEPASVTESGMAESGAAETAQQASGIPFDTNTIEPLTVALLGKDIKIACVIIAMQQGLFEQEGLDVSYESLQNLNDAMTATSTGQIDVLPFGVIPSSTFVGQGSDVVIFGGTIQEGSEAISTPENKDAFKTADDFRGKKLGCFRMETGHMVMKGVLRNAGLNVNQDDPNKDVEFVQLDSSASTVAAVQNGEIDLGFVNSGYGYVAQQGGAAVAFKVGEWQAGFPCCRQTTNRTFFENNKGALVKFEIALLRAYEIYKNDKATTIANLVAYSGQPEEYVEAVIYGNADYDPAMIIQIDPATNQVCDFYQTMIDNGDIDASTPYRMEDHVDSLIFKTALEEMIDRGDNADIYTTMLTTFEKNNTLGV